MTYNIPEYLQGITEAKVVISREKYGYKRLESVKKDMWINLLIDMLIAISFYQYNRSKKALEELEKLNEPLSK